MQLDVYNWLLVFLRISAFLMVLPFFSIANFPVTMRVAVGALGALLLAPMLPPIHLGQMDFLTLLGVLAQEISVGLLLGFVARLIFYAAELAGSMIATEMGLNMASIVDPSSGASSVVPSTVLFYLATLLMLTLNLHQWLLLGFARTYTILPVGGAHLNGTLFETIVSLTGNVFLVALQITAPVIAVSFLILMVFSVLGRAVPQMNVFAESFSFRIVGGLIVFGLTLQLAAQYLINGLNRLPNDLLSVAQMLAAK